MNLFYNYAKTGEKMIIITGNKGQLGYDLENECNNRSIEYFGIDRDILDITDKDAVSQFFAKHKIDAVIHCAAFTAVDLAEDQKELCFNVNTEGTKNLANACQKVGAKFLFISTDYVFDGLKDGIYDTDDEQTPKSVYGQSKADAEQYIKTFIDKYFIVRISWAFGLNGKNFIRTMLRLGKDKDVVSVVDDQIGSPTYTKDVARLLIDIIISEKYGIYHATNEGFCSWAELAQYVMKKAKLKASVKSIHTSEYPTKAYRPLNSRLSKEKLSLSGFNRLPKWQDAVDRYLEELLENEGQL